MVDTAFQADYKQIQLLVTTLWGSCFVAFAHHFPFFPPRETQILAVNQTGGGFFEPILHSKWLGGVTGSEVVRQIVVITNEAKPADFIKRRATRRKMVFGTCLLIKLNSLSNNLAGLPQAGGDWDGLGVNLGKPRFTPRVCCAALGVWWFGSRISLRSLLAFKSQTCCFWQQEFACSRALLTVIIHIMISTVWEWR